MYSYEIIGTCEITRKYTEGNLANPIVAITEEQIAILGPDGEYLCSVDGTQEAEILLSHLNRG